MTDKRSFCEIPLKMSAVALVIFGLWSIISFASADERKTDQPSLSLFDEIFLRWLQSRNGPATTSMEPRDVTLVSVTGKAVKLRIPEAYIDRAGGRDLTQTATTERPSGSVSMLTFLPDLLPKHLAAQAGHMVHGKGCCGIYVDSPDRVHITIWPRRTEWSGYVAVIKRNHPFDRIADGYEVHFSTYRMSPDAPKIKYEEILIPLDTEDAVIHCGFSQKGERIACTIELAFDEVMAITFSLSNIHLPERKAVETKVRQLIASMIVPDAPRK
jgi:hypothetical protein